MSKRRSYLLFEVLLALSLAMLCLFPLLKPHLSMKTLTEKRLAYHKGHRSARLAFLEIKEHLYEGRYSWKQLNRDIADDTEFGPYTLSKRQSTHKVATKRRYMLLDAEVTIGTETFTKTFLVEQWPT